MMSAQEYDYCVVNTERAAITLVDEFRGAKLGRVSLERPEEA